MSSVKPADEEARSTERPPAHDAEQDDSHPDIAAAILRAKTNASVGRYGPPSATAKINKFDLAQALALTTSDGETIPSSSKPPREDDAPFVAGEVEVVGEEEVNSGVPSVDAKPPVIDIVVAPKEESAIVPKQGSGNLALVVIAALVGFVVIGYVYLTTR